MNFKKIALIVGFVIISVGFGYLLYRFFFAPAAPTPTTPVTPTETGGPTTGLPSAGTGRPTGTPEVAPGGLPTAAATVAAANGGAAQSPTVLQAPVLAPQVGTGGNLGFYNQADGKFYKQLADGTLKELSSKAFPNASKVDWAPQGNKAIIEFPNDSKVIYDFSAARQVTIPSHWQDFSWSADGSEIAAKSIGDDPSNRWLITFNSDGSGAELVAALGENADKVTVSFAPSGQSVAFSDTGEPVGFDQRSMLVIGRNQENYRPLPVKGFGFVPKWSPDGTNIIYSAASQDSGYKPTLWFANAKGATIGNDTTSLGVQTWADKCTFADAAAVYCAVPDDLPEGAGLQRDIADNIPDHLVRVDLNNGGVNVIGRPETDATMTNLTVSTDGSMLWYTDAATGQLHQMRLR